MQLGAVTIARPAGELPELARGAALEPGSELVARVVAAEAGHGTISLAGAAVHARVPHGVVAGQTLRLQVVRIEPHELTVRIQPEAGTASDGHALLQAAGDLAVSGDGELLRTALALAGGRPLWLPDGGAAEAEVNPDAAAADERDGGAGQAAFVLHSPAVGPIEVRISLLPGGVRAAVVVPPGDATDAAESAGDELAGRLGAATGRPAAVSVSARPAGAVPPTPPAGRVDVQA